MISDTNFLHYQINRQIFTTWTFSIIQSSLTYFHLYSLLTSPAKICTYYSGPIIIAKFSYRIYSCKNRFRV